MIIKLSFVQNGYQINSQGLSVNHWLSDNTVAGNGLTLLSDKNGIVTFNDDSTQYPLQAIDKFYLSFQSFRVSINSYGTPTVYAYVASSAFEPLPSISALRLLWNDLEPKIYHSQITNFGSSQVANLQISNLSLTEKRIYYVVSSSDDDAGTLSISGSMNVPPNNGIITLPLLSQTITNMSADTPLQGYIQIAGVNSVSMTLTDTGSNTNSFQADLTLTVVEL